MSKTVCLDFDGVIHEYKGWNNGELNGPLPGAKDFIQKLIESNYQVIIHTTREPAVVKAWLAMYALPLLDVSATKPPAIAYVDDRAVVFRGDFDSAYADILNMKTYWE
jgi:ribonucleotide monophosphatase NagD (HAD superfamily)